MFSRLLRWTGAFALVFGLFGAVAQAASGPPPPKTFGGAKATLYATGLKNPTSFAWGDGLMFAGDSGNSMGSAPPNGGLDVIKNGVASSLTLPQTPVFVAGVAFYHRALYVSGGFLVNHAPTWRIVRLSDWTGTTFGAEKIIYTAPSKYQGFNGIAFGPDGRLYVGSDAGLLNNNDHGPASLSPYLYDILSINVTGPAKAKVFATGMRQPWQIVFAPGSKTPFVSDLGQDSGAKNPPDFLLKVKQGDNYGFPKCNWTPATATACQTVTKPYMMFSPHWNPMGVAIIGKTLYLGSFVGVNGKGGALYQLPVAGGTVKPVVTAFPGATDALAAHNGFLYVGGSANKGFVYRVKP